MLSTQELSDVAHSRLGCFYVWGAKGPHEFDCSGFVYWCLRAIGAPWRDGQEWPRTTANGYYVVSKPVKKSELRPGDVGYTVGTSGTAHHIVLYVGEGYFIEARGRAYGVVKYHIDDPKNGAARRKIQWRRFPWLEWEVEDVTKDQDLLLRQGRLTDVARSYDSSVTHTLLREVIRLLGGNPDVASPAEAAKRAEVERVRKHLKLTEKETKEALGETV